MVSITLTIDEKVYEVLTILAKSKKVKVEQILQDMLIEDLERIQRHMDDPIIGVLGEFVDSDEQTDIASRVKDIIRDEWEPD